MGIGNEVGNGYRKLIFNWHTKKNIGGINLLKLHCKRKQTYSVRQDHILLCVRCWIGRNCSILLSKFPLVVSF